MRENAEACNAGTSLESYYTRRSTNHHNHNAMIRSAQFSIDDILSVLRRRRKLFRIPLILITLGCTVGAFVLPRMYESSTTILVQRDEILNPLVNFTMAVSMASEDRLRTLNEIVLSQSTVELLIDTLHFDEGKPLTRFEREKLIKEVKDRIRTGREGADSFTLTFLDTDPVRAQKAAAFLTSHFIATRLKVENQRNEYAVTFFETKLDDLRTKFEGTQAEVLSSLRQRINEMPIESRSLYTRVEGTEPEIQTVDKELTVYRRALATLRSFPDVFRSDEPMRDLSHLTMGDLPYSSELGSLLKKYDEFARRYKKSYPEMEKLEPQILDVAERMRLAVEAEASRLQNQRWELEKRRDQYIQELQLTSVAEKKEQEKTSNSNTYKNLYEEMKVRLEQARTTRDLAKKASDQFIIIDPPRLPLEPSKPNRVLIILGGLGLGLLMGIISAGVGELIDTRVRTPADVEHYRKRILAYVPDGRVRVGV
jgi:polysaccharide biosynthesis transport protein